MDVIKQQQQKEYQEFIKDKIPRPNLLRNGIAAFVVGGLICDIGQLISNFGKNYFNLSKDDTSAFTAIVLVFFGALLTGLGIYDRIGKFAGAGSIVPITGFANSIVAPAMEFKREGYVLGVGAKMFIIAGPVLVYGFFSSVVLGILYLLFSK